MKYTPERIRKYPLRTCGWLCGCRICEEDITVGEQYYDGGYSRRFHKKCVDPHEETKPAVISQRVVEGERY